MALDLHQQLYLVLVLVLVLDRDSSSTSTALLSTSTKEDTQRWIRFLVPRLEPESQFTNDLRTYRFTGRLAPFRSEHRPL